LRFLLFLALIACASKPISGLKENEREDLQKVNYVLRKHKTDFFDCLAKTGEFTTNKNRVQFNFHILPSGKTSSPEISNLESEVIADCMLAVFNEIEFPRVENETALVIKGDFKRFR
jgi:hypothetical protein